MLRWNFNFYRMCLYVLVLVRCRHSSHPSVILAYRRYMWCGLFASMFVLYEREIVSSNIIIRMYTFISLFIYLWSCRYLRFHSQPRSLLGKIQNYCQFIREITTTTKIRKEVKARSSLLFGCVVCVFFLLCSSNKR